MAMVVDMLAQLAAQKRVTGQDVLAARAVIYGDMHVSAEEAQTLFRINDEVVDDSQEWRDLFIEAMTDYVVRQQEPRGYVDQAKSDWLADWILADGKVRGETELELLIYILEQSDHAPTSLFHFAMNAVRDSVMSPGRVGGDGPTLTADEVAQLRRTVYAFAGAGGGAAISRNEAEILFDLNDAARGRPNDPSWKDLFTKAIGASIMLASGYVAPDRAEAQLREEWLRENPDGVASFYTRMLESFTDPNRAGLLRTADDAVFWARNAEKEAAAIGAAPVSEDEAQWLASRIGRDGVFDDNEMSLLLFVAREAEGVHPAIQALIDQAKAQAGLDAPEASAARTQPRFGRRS